MIILNIISHYRLLNRNETLANSSMLAAFCMFDKYQNNILYKVSFVIIATHRHIITILYAYGANNPDSHDKISK